MIGDPANRGHAVPLTYEQFRVAFANAVDGEEARQLYDTFAVPASGAPLFQAAAANLNPWTDVKVDTKNPDRGPLVASAALAFVNRFDAAAPAVAGSYGRTSATITLTRRPGERESPRRDILR